MRLSSSFTCGLPIAIAAGARNAMRAAEGSGLIVIRQMQLNFLFRNLSPHLSSQYLGIVRGKENTFTFFSYYYLIIYCIFALK